MGPGQTDSRTYDFGTTSFSQTQVSSGKADTAIGTYTVVAERTAALIGSNRCAISVRYTNLRPGDYSILKIMSYTGGVLSFNDNGDPRVPVSGKIVKR